MTSTPTLIEKENVADLLFPTQPIDKTKDQAKGLYEARPKPAPKATPVAETSTYLG